MKINYEIKKIREEKGLTQQELAELTGYTSRSSIAKIENGLVDLSQSKIMAFAKALGVEATSILGWETDNPTPTDKIIKGVNLSEAQFALQSDAEDLSDDELEDVANYINFLKSKRDK